MRTVFGVLSFGWKLHIAVIFILTCLIFYPFLFLALISKKSKKIAFYLFTIWSWTFRILCLYFVRIKMIGTIPKEPVIFVANHASYLDIFLMYSILSKHPFIFLGKSELLKYPLIKTFFKKFNIPVFRGDRIKAARAFVAAGKEVKAGWSLAIFPEGGIPDENNPEMIPFKGGAFQLAKSLNVPIVPMTFLNNHELFSDPSNILGSARPGISHVHIHAIISKDEVASLTQNELNEKCFNIINGPLLERYPLLKNSII